MNAMRKIPFSRQCGKLQACWKAQCFYFKVFIRKSLADIASLILLNKYILLSVDLCCRIKVINWNTLSWSYYIEKVCLQYPNGYMLCEIVSLWNMKFNSFGCMFSTWEIISESAFRHCAFFRDVVFLHLIFYGM